MITGSLRDRHFSQKLKKFEKAFKFLERKDLENLLTGKHIIEGDKIYANIIKTKSKSLNTGKFESHKKYIDIHYLISGNEIIGFCDINKLKITKEYDAEDDSFLYSIPNDYDKINLKPGKFAVFFPNDAHMVSCHIHKENDIHKVITKFSVELLKN